MFNTIIKYSELPDHDNDCDFRTRPSECITSCTDPLIIYNASTKRLIIKGVDINIEVLAEDIVIEKAS